MLGQVKFAVTGATGFVGRHLVRKLQISGHSVTCLSRQSSALPRALQGVQHRQLDNYLNIDTLTRALAGVDVVVHLAARAHVLEKTAVSDEDAFKVANVESAVAVARAARTARARRFVLISSIGVNGDCTNGIPFTENDEPRPQELYAVSKWRAEQKIRSELADGPTDFVILRPTLVYGSECPGNFRLLLNLVYHLPLVPLGALHRPRSLIHVENLCDAIIKASVQPAVSRQTFVLSDGLNFSIAEVARTLSHAFGKDPKCVIPIPEAILRSAACLIGKSDSAHKLLAELAVDSSAFQKVAGWTPPIEPVLGLEETARWFASREKDRSSEKMKRIFDLSLAIYSVALLALPIVVIFLLVRLSSPGPALYWSDRVGKNNRVFRMPKFRSMRVGTPALATHLLKDPDAYVTPIGFFLRKSSLDELPQLWSILVGDMSFVGPRPALFNQDDLIALRSQHGAHKLTPGLTGWAQVNGRDELPLLEKVKLDSEYLRRRSLWFDIRILWLTFVKVLRQEGVSH